MIVLAFPGMGKTPHVKNTPGCVDLDFGFLRSAFGVSKADEILVVPIYADLIKMYLAEGYVVFINEPKVLALLQGYSTICFLPDDLEYSARKLGVSNEQAARYVFDWFMMAQQYGVHVTWLKEGLDTYLAGASPTASFTKRARNAYSRAGYRLRNASPGLRSDNYESE